MNQKQGIEICEEIYPTLSSLGYFPALTGGLLYKEGERKDCDIVIFRHRQDNKQFELREIENILKEVGFTNLRHYGFVTKAQYKEHDVDLFNPETCSSNEIYEGLV